MSFSDFDSFNRLDPDSFQRSTVDWSPTALVDRKVDALVDYEEMGPSELIAEGRRITMIRLADFGVRLYSLNLVVGDAAWADAYRAVGPFRDDADWTYAPWDPTDWDDGLWAVANAPAAEASRPKL